LGSVKNFTNLRKGGEKYNLVEDDASDSDCTDGKVYKLTRQLNSAGDFIRDIPLS
jgi:hypothetical protein